MGVRTLVLTLGCAALLAGCSGSSDGPTPVSVTSGVNACDVAPNAVPEGSVVFGVQNGGTQPLSFTVTGGDGAVAAQISGIGPGEAKDLVATLSAGSYTAECEPGASTPLTVE